MYRTYPQVNTCKRRGSCPDLTLRGKWSKGQDSASVIILNLLEDFPGVTQESQLAVVHHELNAVDLQRFCILCPERRRPRLSELPIEPSVSVSQRRAVLTLLTSDSVLLSSW